MQDLFIALSSASAGKEGFRPIKTCEIIGFAKFFSLF
jgi:hypothetical protein